MSPLITSLLLILLGGFSVVLAVQTYSSNRRQRAITYSPPSKPIIQRECPICLDELKDDIKKLPCLHQMHSKCYDDYAMHGRNEGPLRCPLCRKLI